MFKALKDNKIIAISDTDSEFFCLVKDEVITDEGHNAEDYVQVNGEYVLTTDERAIAQANEQRIVELKQYLADTDYVANKLIEALDEAERQDLLEKYAEVLAKRREARAEINNLEKNV